MDAQTSPWAVDYVFAEEDKKTFAGHLLRDPAEPLKAAIATFGAHKDDVGKCSWVAAYWPQDREVIAHSIALLSHGGAADFLPTKDEAMQRVWQWTQSGPYDERIKAMRLLADIADWIPKPGTSVNVTVQNRVMEVPVAASDADWEQAAQTQQAQLVKSAVSVH